MLYAIPMGQIIILDSCGLKGAIGLYVLDPGLEISEPSLDANIFQQLVELQCRRER